jgi:hypothetical protein
MNQGQHDLPELFRVGQRTLFKETCQIQALIKVEMLHQLGQPINTRVSRDHAVKQLSTYLLTQQPIHCQQLHLSGVG